MSEYIGKDKVLEYIIFEVVGKDITCGELKRGIESLPTVEVNKDCISREQVRAKLDYISYAEKDPITIAKRIVENAPSVVPTEGTRKRKEV